MNSIKNELTNICRYY